MEKSKNKNQKKKKVLFLSPLTPPFYGSSMSSEMCLDILKNSKDFNIKNIKLNYSKEISNAGKLNLNKIKGIFKVKKNIKKELKKFNPDTIYFMPATSSFGLIRDYLFVEEIKKNWNREILFHLRSRISQKDWNNKFYRRLYKKMFLDEKVIVLDESLERDLHNLTPKKNIVILPNAIKNEISEKQLKTIIGERGKSNEFNILFLSNMDETKGWFRLLEACKILKEKGIGFKCNFVGEWLSNKEKDKFFNYIKENKLEENAFYLGGKRGKEKNNIFKKSNVLVFPTEYKLETFGRVIIEAMMFGLPVIANGIASIPTTVQDGKTGFVLKENTKEEIAEKIGRLINGKKLRTKMGIAGRKRFLKYYTLDVYKKKFLEVLIR